MNPEFSPKDRYIRIILHAKRAMDKAKASKFKYLIAANAAIMNPSIKYTNMLSGPNPNNP